jgi:undecaprenyl-diphosphatase
MQFIESLNKIDTNLFLLINQANTDILDKIMYYASSTVFWIPFYILLFVLIIVKYNWRKGLIALLFVLVAVGIADLTSVHLFKNVFQRLRPCYQPELEAIINNIVGCGGIYGFVSSHAANSFAIVAIVTKLIGDKYKWLKWLMPLWGILILYSRIYLGKHYPADVIAGAILGMLIGWLVYLTFVKTIIILSKKVDKNGAPFFHSQ